MHWILSAIIIDDTQKQPLYFQEFLTNILLNLIVMSLIVSLQWPHFLADQVQQKSRSLAD